jgi:hypothetical protein
MVKYSVNLGSMLPYFFVGWNFAKFQPMQNIFHGKNDPNSPDFEYIYISKLPNFYDKLQ